MKDIIEMAREAGFVEYELEDYTSSGYDIRYERFAALVRADALVKPCCQDFVKCQQVCMPRAAAAEREACAKVIESHGPFLANGAMLAEAIRARGQA